MWRRGGRPFAIVAPCTEKKEKVVKKTDFCQFFAGRQLLNTELNDLRKISYLRKSEVIVERILVCNVIEKLMAHDMHSLPWFYLDNVLDLLP